MNDKRLDITFLSLPERAQAALQIYVQGAGREVLHEVSEDQAEVALFDYDHPASRAHWERFSNERRRPGIVLSINEQFFPDAIWIAKPVTATTLAAAVAQLRDRLGTTREPAASANFSGNSGKATRVALLSLEPRNEAALNLFFRGEGRSIFSPCAEEDAEIAIFDYDLPASRSHWERFKACHERPGIAFSVNERSFADAIWVRKPVTGAGLLAAAAALAHPKTATAAPSAPVTLDSATAAATEVQTRLPLGTPEAPAEAHDKFQGLASLASDTPSPTPIAAAAPPSAEVLPATVAGAPAAPVRDWVRAPEERKSASVLRWIAAGLALVVGLWFWLGSTSEKPRTEANDIAKLPPAQNNRESAESSDPLRSAVDTSIAQYRAKSAADQNFIAAQMDELYKRGAGAIEDVKAKLDRLAGDPKAQAEHNQSVYNKVHIAPDNPAEQAGSDTAERELRSKIESAIDAASADNKGDLFASAIRPETKVREAEMRTIVVRKGDTLSAIAQRAYGDAALYMKIFEANPRVLTSPDHVFPDQVLRVPN